MIDCQKFVSQNYQIYLLAEPILNKNKLVGITIQFVGITMCN